MSSKTMAVYSTLPSWSWFIIWILVPVVYCGDHCSTRTGYQYCSYGCCERQCCDKETTALGLILGVVFGIILPMALIVTCLVYCFCYGGRQRFTGGRFGRVHHGHVATVHTGYPGQVVYANQGYMGPTVINQPYMTQPYMTPQQTTVIHTM